MCGIFGIFNIINEQYIDKKLVKASSDLLNHRGPDAFGQWGIPNKIELAHLRLSIIDLSPESNQPFFSSCGNYVIVFNGEIYNYIELRTDLEKLGYTFRTKSDTEVLLASYIEWKNQCVIKFNGDWAFAIYDIKENTLFCSRDRFGAKPFNYAIVNNQFIFSSEIKAIINYFPQLRKPNYNIIANFCRNSLGAQVSQTWFCDVFRLMPAHNLLLSNGELKIFRYWDYPKEIDKSITFDTASQKYYQLFEKAIRVRMRSDVPVGITLSSGLDSSSIACILASQGFNNMKSFTAIFKKEDYEYSDNQLYTKEIEIDEKIIVRKLCGDKKIESNYIETPLNDYVTTLKDNIWHLESGNSSPATIPLSKVYKFATKHIKVVLEGQGADELLGGYIQNLIFYSLFNEIKKLKLLEAIRSFLAFSSCFSIKYSFILFFRVQNSFLFEWFYLLVTNKASVFTGLLKRYKKVKDFPVNPFGFDDILNRELYKSHSGGLVNLLHYGDAISLSHAVESRLPFLDYELVEFSFKMPGEFKVKEGLNKFIHRNALRNILPKYISDQKVKYGFTTPLSRLFSSYDSDAVKILLSKECLNRNIFREAPLRKMIENNILKRKDNSSFLFRLLNTELWFRSFIDDFNPKNFSNTK